MAEHGLASAIKLASNESPFGPLPGVVDAVAAALIVSGPYAWAFWGVVVALGILVPLALQGLELGHRIPHTVVPALLVLVGGFALRWVMVNAGQMSHIVQAAGM